MADIVLTAGKLTAGAIRIIRSSGHPETRVKYTQASGLPDATFNIEGELSASSIDNSEYAEEIDVGNTVSNIGQFSGHINLTSIIIGNNVTSIESYAFVESGLVNVTIPDSVTSIEEGAFAATSVTTVTITSNGGNAETVKQALINAGVYSEITWNMPSDDTTPSGSTGTVIIREVSFEEPNIYISIEKEDVVDGFQYGRDTVMIGGVNVVSPNGDAWPDASNELSYSGGGGSGMISLNMIFPWLMGESGIYDYRFKVIIDGVESNEYQF